MKYILISLVWLVMPVGAVLAGGPIHVAPSGVVSAWGGGFTLHPEGGGCGDFTNDEMLDFVEEAVAVWEGVAGSSLVINVDNDEITEEVDENNFSDYFVNDSSDPGLTDGLNPVIYDQDGSIVNDVFGGDFDQVVLGFAGPSGFSADFETIIDGQAVFNCRCLPGNENCGGTVFTVGDLRFTAVHEFGHLQGYDHTQERIDIADDSSLCRLAVDDDCLGVATMYPVSEDPIEQISLERDDEVALLGLYGEATLADDFVTVTASLTDADGNPLRCAYVRAIPADENDTISTVSGYYAETQELNQAGTTAFQYTDGDGECLSGCGDVLLRGLDPDLDYEIRIEPIDSRWTGGSSISPCGTGQISGIEQETITNVSADDVSAGDVVAVGTFQTVSTGGIEEGEEQDNNDDGDEDGNGGSGGGGGGCQLNHNSNGPSFGFFWLLILPFILVYRRWRDRALP